MKISLNNANVWLTKTGLMVKTPATGYFFCDNTGSFRRFASLEEGALIESYPNIREIEVTTNNFSDPLYCEVPEDWNFILNHCWIGENIADYRPYGVGQMQISGDIVTICVSQVEPGEDVHFPDGYTTWRNFKPVGFAGFHMKDTIHLLEMENFHLVG